jgi:succinylarginine dihydrolase
MHEEAFVDKVAMQAELQKKFGEQELHFIEVPTERVSLQSAVKSYLFNSQLVQLDDGMALILPEESRDNQEVYAYLQWLETQDTPIKHINFVDVRQSMQNGGGPACLRLRVALNETELAGVNQNFLVNDDLCARLSVWINKHYREEIKLEDLADPQLAEESFAALDELTQVFDLGAFYEFQQ